MKPLLVRMDIGEGSPFGMNWRSPSYPGSGALGSASVIRPDPISIAQAWKAGGGKTKSEWEEHAKRMGLFPDDVSKGWDAASKDEFNEPPKPEDLPRSEKPTSGPPVGLVTSRASRFGEAVSKLKSVIGEATSWWGYSVPGFHMMKTPYTPGPGFGFHTKSAEEVWRFAKQVADEDPKEQTASIVSKALDRAKVMATELTPEDTKMLDMAINWYLSGKSAGMEMPTPPSNGNRIGGMPGGPFRSTGLKGSP